MRFVLRGVVGPSVIGIVVEPLSIPENQLVELDGIEAEFFCFVTRIFVKMY